MREWPEKTEIPATRLADGLGIGRSKYHEWRRRHGKVNGHNAWIARGHWLEDWEKEAIVAHYPEHQDDGYRRLTHMLLDEDMVAVSPGGVHRVLTGADSLRRRNRAPSKKGMGSGQPLKPREHRHTDISQSTSTARSTACAACRTASGATSCTGRFASR